jgi:hypothetical protein
MKFVKVTAIAAAMMATFGAQAELTAMDDSALEAVTGQEGITIEQSLSGMSVWYVDGDGSDLTGAASGSNSGAIAIEGISLVSAADTTSAAGSLTMAVDVADTTPGGAGAAIRIQQTVTAGSLLGIDSIKVGTAATGAVGDSTVIAAASGGTSIGSVYVDMGAGVTMYVYGH